jgi:hypothetical protein
MPALPATEFEFPGQAPHAAADTAATDVLYKLSPHSVQAAEPIISLYFPAPQAVHVPPSGPVNPGLHTQLVCAVDATTADCVLAAQSVHAAVPVAALYFPAKQAVHATPLSPVCPRAQIQAPTAVCPVADVTEFAGQSEHALSTAPPVYALYLPAPQSVHESEPIISLYFPATQAVHVPPFSPVNPLLQTQAVAAVCAVNACPEFDRQSVHAAVPVVALYFPAKQAVHATPLSPVCPRAQIQSPTAVCPVADVTEFSGQAMHWLSATAPVDPEYLSTAQSKQVANND